jgi:hypothetical protein
MVSVGYTDSPESVEKELRQGPTVPANYPTRVAAWIMSKLAFVIRSPHNTELKPRCDDIDIKTGATKPLSEARHSYAYAQKMRAAVSHKFGRELQKGTQIWTEDSRTPGHFLGNPSLSTHVSQYMISLRRRKVSSQYSS